MKTNQQNEDNFFKEIRQRLDSDYPVFREEDWINMRKKLESDRKQKENIGKKRNLLFSWKFYAAASIALIVSFAFIYNMFFNYGSKYEFKTNHDKMEVVFLPDKSEVWLNKDSKLIYSEKNGIREAQLSGEAFFNIKNLGRKEFRVITQKSVISVVGTSFNVNAYPGCDKEITTVATGIVTIKFNDKKTLQQLIVLEKNQACIFYNDKLKIVKEENNNMNYLSWKTKYLEFINTPLLEVAGTLSGYYDKKIVIQDSDLYNVGLNCTFQDESLFEVLKIIQLTLQVGFEIQSDTVILKKINNDQNSLYKN